VQDQFRSEAAAAMLGLDIDLFEMCHVAVDHLDVRKADGSVIRHNNPQLAVTLSVLERLEARRLAQDGFGGEATKQPGGCQLNRWQPNQILPARRSDCVALLQRLKYPRQDEIFPGPMSY
jgi:hypothetical protein